MLIDNLVPPQSMVILLIITITISSNVIGTIAALFFANNSIQLSLDTWLQSDSWSSQSYWVYPANSTYHRTSHNKHSNKHLSLKYWEISKMEITNCENFDISPKQIEENQSKIIVDERLPSCSLSLITKIVLIIFTTANDVLNLSHCLLMFLVTLKSENIKIIRRNIIRARVRQHWAKTLWSLLKGTLLFFRGSPTASFSTFWFFLCVRVCVCKLRPDLQNCPW